jgi:hypothetical protein
MEHVVQRINSDFTHVPLCLYNPTRPDSCLLYTPSLHLSPCVDSSLPSPASATSRTSRTPSPAQTSSLPAHLSRPSLPRGCRYRTLLLNVAVQRPPPPPVRPTSRILAFPKPQTMTSETPAHPHGPLGQAANPSRASQHSNLMLISKLIGRRRTSGVLKNLLHLTNDAAQPLPFRQPAH